MDDTERYPSDETLLWRGVLLQVLQDCSLPEEIRGPVSIARAEALALICASVGVTLEDFEDVCDMAEVNPSLFREQAQSFVRSGKRFYLRNDSWKTELTPQAKEPSGSR